MNLSDALVTTQHALGWSTHNAGIVARNLASASDVGYVRRTLAGFVNPAGEDFHLLARRAANENLSVLMRSATASASKDQTSLSALDALNSSLNSADLSLSLSAAEADFKAQLKSYALEPSSAAMAESVVAAAKKLTGYLNRASATVDAQKARTDEDIQQCIHSIKENLQDIADVDLKLRSASGEQIRDNYRDQRDKLLTQLSSEISIQVERRPDDSIAIFADNGSVLFDREPRNINFMPYGHSPVRIDGVDVTSARSSMRIGSGKLAGLMSFRDADLVEFQSRIDQIAEALVMAFRETSQTQPTVSTPGLFVLAPTSSDGTNQDLAFALRIKVSEFVDPASGGDPERIRDGAVSDPHDDNFLYNTNRIPEFNTRLLELCAKLESPPSSGVDGPGVPSSIDQQCVETDGWLQGRRRDVFEAHDRSALVQSGCADALHNSVGVDIDEQMELMLAIEQSYQASARLLKAVDTMIGSLLDAVG